MVISASWYWNLRLLWFFSARNLSFTKYARLTNSSGLIIGAHWNGVNGFGTKYDADAVTMTRPFRSSLGIFAKKSSVISSDRSAIPAISSYVSVGRPIMKYSFTLSQPPLKAFRAPSIMFSFVRPLFITFLSLCVPASGANVSELFFTSWILLMTSREKASIRSDGREIFTCSLSIFSIRQSVSFGSSS